MYESNRLTRKSEERNARRRTPRRRPPSSRIEYDGCEVRAGEVVCLRVKVPGVRFLTPAEVKAISARLFSVLSAGWR